MNSKIIKYLKLKAELSAEELKQAESLAAMTETDKQALLEFWGVSKVAKPVKTRVIEKCGVDGCGLTRRAQVHKDVNGHEFQSSKPKSARASSIANAVKKTPKGPRCVACYELKDHTNHDLDNGGHEFTTDLAGRVNAVLDEHNLDGRVSKMRCTVENCGAYADDNIHHLTTHPTYHEFVGEEQAVGVGG